MIEKLPHDPGAFTQGLEYLPEGRFIEGTGMNSRLVQNSSSSVVSQLGHMCTHIPLVRGTILSQSTAKKIHIRNSHAHAHALPTARPPLTQREVDIATGRVLREARLEARHFGEGTTVFNGKVLGLIALHIIPLLFLFVLNPILDGKVLGFYPYSPLSVLSAV